jgi:anti-anti-sigma factor
MCRTDDCVIVSGVVDAAVADALLRALEGPAVGAVDLSEVDFIDSYGVRALAAARARRQEQGLPFELRHPSRAVRRVFELAGLVDWLVVQAGTEALGGDTDRPEPVPPD